LQRASTGDWTLRECFILWAFSGWASKFIANLALRLLNSLNNSPSVVHNLTSASSGLLSSSTVNWASWISLILWAFSGWAGKVVADLALRFFNGINNSSGVVNDLANASSGLLSSLTVNWASWESFILWAFLVRASKVIADLALGLLNSLNNSSSVVDHLANTSSGLLGSFTVNWASWISFILWAFSGWAGKVVADLALRFHNGLNDSSSVVNNLTSASSGLLGSFTVNWAGWVSLILWAFLGWASKAVANLALRLFVFTNDITKIVCNLADTSSCL
jgi:hypothetical protein